MSKEDRDDPTMIGGRAFNQEAFEKSLEYVPPTTEKKIKIVTERGEIDRLTSSQKNDMYARARMLKEQIREALLSQSELDNPTPENVQKHIKGESTKEHNDSITLFRDIMKTLGADPKDYSIEELRRGK